MREEFEEAVYAHYFISQIEKTGLGGPLSLMPNKDTLNKAEFLEKAANGQYKRPELEPMWFGWQLAVKRLEGK